MASKPKAKAPPLDRASAAVLERATALHRGGKLAEAETLYREVLAADAQQFDALHLLGVTRYQQGHHAEAEELIRAARAREPRNVSALSNHGIVLAELGRHAEALICYDRALISEPRHAGVLNNRGTTLKQLGRHTEALACYDRAIAIAPDFADAVSNRGMLLEALERFEEALACFDKAIALDPGHARAHHNRGAILYRFDRFEEAAASFDRALAVSPAYANAFYHRGRALKELQRHDAALASYRQAIALDPDNAAAQWEAGLLALLGGDFAAGWQGYEWRFKVAEVASPRDFAQPQWRGDAPLAGRTILLHAEQGFGDTIQFVRYAPLVAARGATVILEVQRPLASLLHGMTGVSRLVCRGEALPDFDLHCPLASLPLAFATTLDTIPTGASYLRPPAERIASWRTRLPSATPPRPRVGLAWSGNPRHKNDGRRSMSFEALAPLIAMPGIDFVSLQKNPRETDAEALRRCGNVTDIAAGLGDFADTAAAISLLDLMITIDTAVAHLAGSLDKPVWILLPVTVDWRWLTDREDSPWYPTARLFRQPAAGDWPSVIARVRQELAKSTPLHDRSCRTKAQSGYD